MCYNINTLEGGEVEVGGSGIKAYEDNPPLSNTECRLYTVFMVASVLCIKLTKLRFVHVKKRTLEQISRKRSGPRFSTSLFRKESERLPKTAPYASE